MNIGTKAVSCFLLFASGYLTSQMVFRYFPKEDILVAEEKLNKTKSIRDNDSTSYYRNATFINRENGGYISFTEFKAKLASAEGINENAPTFSMDALISYGGALVRALGLKAIEAIQSEPLLADCGPAAPTIFEIMYELHGRDGASALINSYQDKRIQNMLREMLAAKILADSPAEALDYAKKNSPKLLTDQAFIGHIARSLCENKSVEEMIQIVSSFDLPQSSLIAASAVGGMMYSNDPAAIESTISSIISITNTPLRDMMFESYIATAIEINPQILLHPSVSSAKLDDELYYKAGHMMSGKTWDEIHTMYGSIHNSEAKTRLMLGYVDALTEQGDSDLALRQSIDLYNSGDDDGQLMTRTLGNMTRFAPDSVTEFLLGNNLPTEVKSTLSENLISGIASVDLAQAEKIIHSGQFDGITQERLLADIADHLAKEDPVRALTDVFSKIQDPVFSNMALGDITAQYYQKDSNECMNYISNLPASEMRDSMVRTVSHKMMANDPQGALNYAAQITDKKRRIAALHTLFENSRHYQPSLVEQWATNNPDIMKAISEYSNAQANDF